MVLCLMLTLVPTLALAEETTANLEPPRYYDGVDNRLGTATKAFFFANGTPITIEAPAEGKEGALITWEGGSQEVSAATNVFGGAHNNDTAMTTSVTMTGGTVNAVFGGGMHKSHVTQSNVLLKAGVITSQVAGGGASSFATGCGCDYTSGYYAGDAKASPCQVDEANVIVEDGVTVNSLLYGGGEGISCTKVANMTIQGGTFTSCWVVAGGSNGYTGAGNLTINGGEFKVVQGVNRGSMDSIDMDINGGTFANLYIGGETGDTGVTGVYETASADISGANIAVLRPGSNTASKADADRLDSVEKITGVNVAADATIGNLEAALTAFGDKLKVPPVAQIGETSFATLTQAFAKAVTGSEVKLLADVSVAKMITLPENIELTFNLNGFDATRTGGKALLTVPAGTKLSVQGTGSTVRGTLVVNGENATLSINGGTYIATVADDCAIQTNGTHAGQDVTIRNATVQSTDDSLYLAGQGKYTIENSVIEGYTGIYMKAGELAITNTTITANGPYAEPLPDGNGANSTGDGIVMDSKAGYKGNMVLNLGEGVVITSDNGYAVRECLTDVDASSTVKVEITDGAYAGGKAAVTFSNAFMTSETAVLNVTGGHYSSDPTAYLASGKVAVPSDKSGYNYMIADMAANVGTATKEPVVEAAPDVTMTEEDLNKVAQTEADGLTPKLNEVANEIAQNESVTAKAANALTEAGITPAEGEGVSIVVRSFLDIQVQNYAAEGEKILTLDITPKYELVATTATQAADGSYDLKEDTDDKNAAVIPGTETILTDVTVPVTVKVPVPEGFLTSDDANKIFVKHVKSNGATYYYPAKLVMDDSNNSKVVAIEFTTTHGFSPFTIQQDERKGTIQFDTGIGAKEYTAANVGDTLPVPAVPTGKTFGGWTIDGQTYTTLTDGLLTKLSENTTLAAAAYFYTPSYGGATTYSVKLPGTLAGGTVKADRTNASSGTTVTLTVQPAEGYVLDTLTVTDKNGKELTLTNKGNGKYSFTMPASNVTVAASFKDTDAWESPFTDVKSGDWFYDGVAYAYQQGMMNGVSATSFDPYGTTTRGMIVTILYRLEGSPAVSGSAFNDVADGAYYADAVTWASKNGIVTGFGDGAFGPDQAITREQMAAILYRYAAMKGYAVTDRADLTGFADAGSVSDYAKEAMAWANAAGLITGVTSTTLDPQGGAQRCQAAVILARFCQSIVK